MELKNLKFEIPLSIITSHDISKVINEIDAIDDFFLQVKLGKISKASGMPHISEALDEIVQKNQFKLNSEDDRAKIKLMLQTVRSKAPVAHISFAGEPSNLFLEKLISWMRINLDPLLILQIGLQPNIGAGFTIRTTNKFFDFSLKSRLGNNSNFLISEILKGINK